MYASMYVCKKKGKKEKGAFKMYLVFNDKDTTKLSVDPGWYNDKYQLYL